MAQLSLLHLNGTNGSTVFRDEIGTFTWTAVGGAVIGTAQSKFGVASLNVTGGGELDQANTFTAITTWTADCWFRPPSVASARDIFSLVGPTPFNDTGATGASNGFGNTYRISYTGAAANGSVTGSKTTWVANQWYHLEMTYDVVAGKYYFYIDGVKDAEFASATPMSAAGWKIFLGNGGTATPLFGYIDEFRYTNACEHPGGLTFTPPTAEYPVSNAVLTLPTKTLTAEGGVLGEGAAFLTLPTLTLAGVAQPYGSYGTVDVKLLRLTLAAFGGVDNSGTVGIVLPMLTLLSNDDIAARNSLPMLTLLAEGAVGAIGSAVLTLPMLSLSVDGSAPGFYLASNSLPPFSLFATGISGVLGTAFLTLPRPRLTATGLVGTAGVVNIILPSLSFSGSEYGTIGYSASMNLPMLQLVASGYQAELGQYRIWALNTHKNALTEYTNFNFNSFANFAGRVLASGPTGIRVLDATSNDEGTNINSSVRWGNLAYGTSFNKRIPRIYISMRSDGYGKFVTITQGQGQREYLLPSNGNLELQQRRVPIGRGPKSTNWQFGYDNLNGADFAINSLILLPEVLRRRVF